MGASGAVFLAIFAYIERSAKEPVLPMHLFSNRTFSAASAVGFIVGFAMFGAITFLPLFFQVVKGANPTTSGLLLLPLMAGMLVTSIGSGQAISRTGRYRAFPIAGTAIMTVGLVMLSRLSPTTGGWAQTADLVVLGIGLGLVMQVLVLVTQNAVPQSELGVATSGATFFRSIGGSFGAAIFGAIFSNVLVGKLASQLKGVSLPKGFASSSVTPQMLRQLAVPVRHGFVQAYASSIQEVFVIAVPIALLAFVVVWLLPHVELRGAARGPATRLPTAEPAMSGDHAKTTAEINDDPSEAAISR
jgi:MFS family permease